MFLKENHSLAKLHAKDSGLELLEFKQSDFVAPAVSNEETKPNGGDNKGEEKGSKAKTV